MAQATYKARAIVLRKTKLGESDLILTLLLDDGSQARAVAKGARKPTSSFAVRLELFSVVDALFSRGRNLDLIKEVRLIESNENLKRELEYTYGAAPMTDLLDRVTQMGLENPQLFPLTTTALQSLGRVQVEQIPAITAAHLLKVCAFTGFRPSFDRCVLCGRSLTDVTKRTTYQPDDRRISLSYHEGGVVCDSCATHVQTVLESAVTIDWCRVLLGSTFADIECMHPDSAAGLVALRFCQAWIREHIGTNLKSLNEVFTCGFF